MAGERILLVEDNPHNRRLAQFLLQARGYVVDERPQAKRLSSWPGRTNQRSS